MNQIIPTNALITKKQLKKDLVIYAVKINKNYVHPMRLKPYIHKFYEMDTTLRFTLKSIMYSELNWYDKENHSFYESNYPYPSYSYAELINELKKVLDKKLYNRFIHVDSFFNEIIVPKNHQTNAYKKFVKIIQISINPAMLSYLFQKDLHKLIPKTYDFLRYVEKLSNNKGMEIDDYVDKWYDELMTKPADIKVTRHDLAQKNHGKKLFGKYFEKEKFEEI